jgi:hypothetical protein
MRPSDPEGARVQPEIEDRTASISEVHLMLNVERDHLGWLTGGST